MRMLLVSGAVATATYAAAASGGGGSSGGAALGGGGAVFFCGVGVGAVAAVACRSREDCGGGLLAPLFVSPEKR